MAALAHKLAARYNRAVRAGAKGSNCMMNGGYNGLIGLLILAGDIWALINIFQSSVSNEKKLLWILVVVLLPLLGLILWYFLGPRGRTV